MKERGCSCEKEEDQGEKKKKKKKKKRKGKSKLFSRCIPSKALLNASHKYHELHTNSFEQFGVKIAGVTLDLAKMLKQKDDAVTGLTGGIEYLFKKNGVRYVKGKASFAGPKSLSVALADGGSEQIEAKNIVIATGSDIMDLPGVKRDEKFIVSSTGALDIAKVPKNMLVIGGGVIGLELGFEGRKRVLFLFLRKEQVCVVSFGVGRNCCGVSGRHCGGSGQRSGEELSAHSQEAGHEVRDEAKGETSGCCAKGKH
jgi:hypothetical protein